MVFAVISLFVALNTPKSKPALEQSVAMLTQHFSKMNLVQLSELLLEHVLRVCLILLVPNFGHNVVMYFEYIWSVC